MNPLEQLKKKKEQIEKKLGYIFKDPDLLFLSLVHRSFFNEHKKLLPTHNERLEFLGDSVLGLISANYLYKKFPKEDEGTLSSLRSVIVEASSCTLYLKKLGIEKDILLGKGEKDQKGEKKASILANAFEAVICAIYLDGGWEKAEKFFLKNFEDDIKKIIESPSKNFKAILQEYTQKHYQTHPSYKITKEEGPDHSKIFHVDVTINKKKIGSGMGNSKKQAEQMAAKNALDYLQKVQDG